MRALKSLEEFLEDGTIKKIYVNIERSKNIILETERKLNSLNERLEKIGIKDDNANDYVEYCYDILMLLIRAKLYLKGYTSGGQGAHEAEVSYLRILEFNEIEVQFMDKMRYFRNGILYYGTMLDAEYAKKVILFTKVFYPKLKKIVEESLSK